MLKTLFENELRQRRATEARTIDLVCAADDAYAMPLAVTLRSMSNHLSPQVTARVFVLDGGISEISWAGLKETLADTSIELCAIRPDVNSLADLSISHHISHTAYFRLLSAELLPTEIDKAIYLDSDLLIRDDLVQLWDRPLGNSYCLATVDIACPYIDARLGCANFRLASPYLAARRPIRNYRKLDLDGRGEYFNSGVMVMNLARWRRDNVAERLLRCLRDNQRFVWCWDQYALNVVFAGEWDRFSPRWNQGAHVFEYPSERYAPIDSSLWLEMKRDPAIVHFTTEFKPWQFASNHPRGHLFYEGLLDTAWRDWRPTKPTFQWRTWLDRFGVKLNKRITQAFRKVTAIWG